jgi:hypothetical protein
VGTSGGRSLNKVKVRGGHTEHHMATRKIHVTGYASGDITFSI